MKDAEMSLKPWEQHYDVIIIPRFDYNAPSSLLQHYHTGFLITCPIKREKSATKEAMSILQQYLGSSNAGEIMDGQCTETNETLSTDLVDDADKISECSSVQDVSRHNGDSVRLSLVKLTSSGLLLFIFPNDRLIDTIEIVSSIFQDLGTGNLKSPRWCHRIFPIQATCIWKEKELHAVVSKLIREFVNNEKKKHVGPVKYAVGFNRRGLGEKVLEPSKSSSDTSVADHLDRSKCFEIVGSAVKDVIPDSTVDLYNPELSILLEFLPLSGVPNGSPVVAVSVLASNFVVTKPKLCVKALLSASKMTDNSDKAS